MINSAFSLAFNGSALLSNQKEMIWNKSIFQVTTSTDGHGSITASPMSGFSGTQVTLSNTPNANYGFQGYSVTGATLTGNKFTLNNDVTARATFNQTGTIYYTNNNSYSIMSTQVSDPPSSRTINMNVHTVPYNYATMKYHIYSMGRRSWMTVHASGYSNEAREIYGRPGTYHDFDSSAGFWIDNTVIPSAKSAMIKFIIDRSAGLYSSFKDSTLIGNGPFVFNCVNDHYVPITATANSINGIGNIYWASYVQDQGGGHSMSGLKVGGFTSYNDAYNF